MSTRTVSETEYLPDFVHTHTVGKKKHKLVFRSDHEDLMGWLEPPAQVDDGPRYIVRPLTFDNYGELLALLATTETAETISELREAGKFGSRSQYAVAGALWAYVLGMPAESGDVIAALANQQELLSKARSVVDAQRIVADLKAEKEAEGEDGGGDPKS